MAKRSNAKKKRNTLEGSGAPYGVALIDEAYKLHMPLSLMHKFDLSEGKAEVRWDDKERILYYLLSGSSDDPHSLKMNTATLFVKAGELADEVVTSLKNIFDEYGIEVGALPASFPYVLAPIGKDGQYKGGATHALAIALVSERK